MCNAKFNNGKTENIACIACSKLDLHMHIVVTGVCYICNAVHSPSSRRYREYAFVRTDEEREQFLYHLLTLTARDFSCFTTGFHSASMFYIYNVDTAM